jgi:ribose transport system ATP-binding protein
LSVTDSGTPGESDKRASLRGDPASGEQAAVPPAVELCNISKDFGSNRALDQVNLRIGYGEVVGLLGQNGSGKSTLVKVLAGVYDPEPGGRLFVGGEEMPLPLPPGQASEVGLSFVYQNLALAPGLSVLENLTLGQRIAGGLSTWKPINWLSEHRRAAAVLDHYDVKLDLDRRTGDLVPVDQARLAIVELVDLIVGAPARPDASVPAEAAPVEDQHAVALTLAAMESVGDVAAAGENVVVEHLTDTRVHDLSFGIGAGEILGVAGLIGSGAEELPYLLFGAQPALAGTLRLGAETLDIGGLSPQRSVRERVALVPADRAVQGLSQSLTLWENIVMLVEDEHYRSGVFHRGELVTLAGEAIDRFLIRPPLAHNAVSTFSGGNQQKALLAKWLLARPRLLLLHEPTQGVDVGARRDIYRFVKSAAALHHMAVLWVTTEFGELAEICDRVIVITQGRQTAELAGEELSEEAISAAALRQTREAIP